MNRKILVCLLAVGVFSAAQAQDDQTNDPEKLSYAMGYQFGAEIKARDLGTRIETLLRAIRDGFAGNDPAYASEELAAELEVMQKRIYNEQVEKFNELAEENQQRSEEYLAENRQKAGVKELPSGVQYMVLSEGSGPKPTLESEVSVHYRGQRMNGFEFDSSFARGAPGKFKVDAVLRGWQEVLPLMNVGSEWRIWVPPELAFAGRGQRPIGPNEALQFDLKLVDIHN